MRKPGLLLVLFICSTASADTITLKNGKQIKGLVVEQHKDRILLSTATEKHEIPILLKGIKDIQYDTPEQNFMQIGKSFEQAGRLGEALAYYQKALEANPGFTDAARAAVGVRNRFWAMATEGPKGEIEKKQLLYDSWGAGKLPAETDIQKLGDGQVRVLREGLGVALEKKGDWLRFSAVDVKKPAALAGLKKNDRLVSIDGRSLRYLGAEVVDKELLEPRYSNFTLETERDIFLHKEPVRRSAKDLGLKLVLEYEGLVVDSVKQGSAAETAGLKERDLVTQVNGISTRYMPLSQVNQLIQNSIEDRILFAVRRSFLLARS